MSENEIELYLEVYHYPLDKIEAYKYYDDWRVRKAFRFKPRVFRAGGTTNEALEKVIAFIEEKLEKSEIEVEVEIKIEAELTQSLTQSLELEELKMRGSVFLSSSSLRIRINELKRLYSRVYSKTEQLFSKPRIMIDFVRPIRISLTKEDYKRLFEELLNTDAQLNVETARKLFGKNFAEKVSEHNRQIRASKN